MAWTAPDEQLNSTSAVVALVLAQMMLLQLLKLALAAPMTCLTLFHLIQACPLLFEPPDVLAADLPHLQTDVDMEGRDTRLFAELVHCMN